MWLGIANGVLARGLGVLPLAIRYLAAGLVANFVSGYATELITRRIEKRQGIRLERKVDLWTEQPGDPAKAETGQPGGTEVTKQYFGTEDSAGHTGYRSIKIVSGDGGYGGPLTITPTPEKHTVIYLTGGGREPEPLAKILALSGMDAVNMSSESCPEEKVALAIIDCGGTLRCGIYPKKRIPTVNIMATGKERTSGAIYYRRYLCFSRHIGRGVSGGGIFCRGQPHCGGQGHRVEGGGPDGSRKEAVCGGGFFSSVA